MSKIIRTAKNRLEISADRSEIWKYFQSDKEYLRELQIYQQKPEFAPRMLGFDSKEKVLKLEYLEAKTILEIEADFPQIAHLFFSLHKFEENTICLCDVNPKNILFDPASSRYFLIDFSDWQHQPKEYDLIRFLLFWASILPYEGFNEVANKFYHTYDELAKIDRNLWNVLLPIAIIEFDERRKNFNRRKAIEEAEPEKNRERLRRLK